jgi:hypothetical protein
MKVLYLSTGVSTDGVRKKLQDKVIALQRQGVTCRLCVIASDKYSPVQEENTDFITVNYSPARKVSNWPLLWRLSVVIEQYLTYRHLTDFIQKQDVDIILLRYPVADYFFWRFMKQLRTKIVFEHNTMEIEELMIRSVNSFFYKYFLRGEMRYGKRVRSKAAGLISVTPEISIRQAWLSGGNVPVATISNGIAVDRVPLKKEIFFDGKHLNLLLLSGSEAPWHGIDILLKSIENYKGECKVNCYIAGNLSEALKERVKLFPFVTSLPTQTGTALDNLIDKCHLGVGTLGLTTKFMKQACTLKVREYWSRGLPFILGYEDVDLEGDDAMKPFYHRIDVDHREDFDFELVVNFAREVYRMENISGKMRELAFQQIHYPVKAAQYVAFLKKLLK